MMQTNPFIRLLAGVIVLGCAIPALAADKANLYVLTVAYNEDDTPDDFNFAAQEVEAAFKTNSASLFGRIETRMLLGDQSTRQNVLDGLTWLAEHKTERDLAIVYLGAHGTYEEKEGYTFWAAEEPVYGHQLKKALAKIPGPVVLLLDTCYSGSLFFKHEDDLHAMPANVIALSACKPEEKTWRSFTTALCEGVWGFADYNKDGVVDMHELIRYITERLVFWYPKGETAKKLRRLIVSTPKKMDLSFPIATVNADLYAVHSDERWWGARVVTDQGGQCVVHYLGAPDNEDEVVPRDRLCRPTEAVRVRRGGAWVAARLVSREQDKGLIHYMGDGGREDETIAFIRLKYAFPGSSLPDLTTPVLKPKRPVTRR